MTRSADVTVTTHRSHDDVTDSVTLPAAIIEGPEGLEIYYQIPAQLAALLVGVEIGLPGEIRVQISIPQVERPDE